jgi:hypothetical protein
MPSGAPKVEYARAHGLEHPYGWPREAHEAWNG